MSSMTMSRSFHEPGSPQDLARRLALVGPKDTTRGFLFGSTLEAVKAQTTTAALQRCAQAAGREHFTAFFSYPIAMLLKLTYAASRELRGLHGGFDGTMQHLGARAAPRFLESAAGKMLLSLVGREPQRLFESMPTAYRTAWDHGSCTVAWTGPRSGQLRYATAIPVGFFVGSVRQILAAGRLTGRVTGHQTDLAECTVDFSWQ